MNAINLASLFQFTAINKQTALVGVLIFGAIVVYRMIIDGDWLAKILGVIILVAAVSILSGCTNGPTDPLGATSRTRLRTDASVSIAQADADARARVAQADAGARIAQAQADETARIAESNALIITEQSKQNGATARAGLWSGMIPLALLIVASAVVLGLVINWQGRIYYERTRQTPQLAEPSPWPQLPPDKLRLLQNYARRSGQWVSVIEGEYYLSDGQGRKVKALLKG